MFLTFHFHIFQSVFLPEVLLSPFAIIWALWGADAAKFRSERWPAVRTGRRGRAAAVESKYGFLSFPTGPKECTGNVFCQNGVQSSACGHGWKVRVRRFGFERQDGNSEALLWRAHGEALGGVYLFCQGGDLRRILRSFR